MPELSDLRDMDGAEAAQAAGLRIDQMTMADGDFFGFTTPAVTSMRNALRLRGLRAVDPSRALRETEAIFLKIESQPAGETHWSSFSGHAPLLPQMMARWRAPVLKFLHHGDAAGLADELARKEQWITGSALDILRNYTTRRDNRIHGVPRYGDLCVSAPGLVFGDEERHIFRLLDQGREDSGPLHFEVVASGGQLVHQVSLQRCPVQYPYLKKLCPLTLETLPEGLFSRHAKLQLLGYQMRIEAARAQGQITPGVIAACQRAAAGAL